MKDKMNKNYSGEKKDKTFPIANKDTMNKYSYEVPLKSMVPSKNVR